MSDYYKDYLRRSVDIIDMVNKKDNSIEFTDGEIGFIREYAKIAGETSVKTAIINAIHIVLEGDVVKVIRCKDCIRHDNDEHFCAAYRIFTPDWGYCFNASRREGE